ncbi:MAG: hypothetical protein GY841_15330 [FCB group bacterium]|nr:hypothetical protein [FCB group bacterium]
MKFVKEMLKFSDARGVMEKQAKDVKAGNKELAPVLKSNIEVVELHKGISENGVISDDSTIVIEVDEKKTPQQVQNYLMLGLQKIEGKVDEIAAGMKKSAVKTEPVKKEYTETQYMLERMIYKFRARMNAAQSALDTIDFASLDKVTGDGKSEPIKKADVIDLLNFDAIVEECGEESVSAVKKMIDENGAPEGEETPDAEEEKPDGEEETPDGDDTEPDAETSDDGDGDDKEQQEESQKDNDDDEDDTDSFVNDLDLSPPLEDVKDKK